jgi:hypothetical protein
MSKRDFNLAFNENINNSINELDKQSSNRLEH